MPRSAKPATFLASTTVNQYRNGKLADERSESQRTQDRAGSEIAEDGIEAEPAHQRNDDAGSAEQDESIAVDGNIDRRRHLSLFVRSRRARHIMNGAISTLVSTVIMPTLAGTTS